MKVDVCDYVEWWPVLELRDPGPLDEDDELVEMPDELVNELRRARTAFEAAMKTARGYLAERGHDVYETSPMV